MKPQFTLFKQFFTDNFVIAKGTFDIYLNLISNASTFLVFRSNLDMEIHRLEEEKTVIESERVVTKLEKIGREDQLDFINMQIEAGKLALEARKAQLKNAKFPMFLSDAFQIGMALLSTYTTGNITGLEKAISSMSGLFLNKPLAEEDVGLDISSKYAISNDPLHVIGGIAGLISTTAMLIDRQWVHDELAAGTSDPIIHAIVKELSDLTFQAKMAELQVVQGDVMLSIAEGKINNADAAFERTK